MTSFILKRTGQSLLLIFGLLTATFLILHLAPGDPANIYVRPGIDAKTVQLVRHNLRVDESISVQYLHWIARLLQGDLGISFSKHRPVVEIFKEAVPATLQLTLLALFLDLALGTLFGVICALKKYSKLDHGLTLTGLILYSIPDFWLALMLILIFSLKLGWLPSSQMFTFGMENPGFWLMIWDRMRHLILPAVVLGIASAAYTARFVRGSMLEVLRQDYIRTARAKGLSQRRIFFKHALRNALLPLITLFGLSFPFLLGGAVIVETLFAWPGMGRIAVEAIFAKDYPVVLAANLLAGVMVISGNLVADLLYGVADPRVRDP